MDSSEIEFRKQIASTLVDELNRFVDERRFAAAWHLINAAKIVMDSTVTPNAPEFNTLIAFNTNQIEKARSAVQALKGFMLLNR
jgi:hypothetical protein